MNSSASTRSGCTSAIGSASTTTAARIATRARSKTLEHDLPYFDEHVHFPDLRIEYEDIGGRRDHEDVEVVTLHYRGAHGAAVARSGFSCYGGSSARISGRSGGGRRHGGLAEELLR
jgi:hypothetical protein